MTPVHTSHTTRRSLSLACAGLSLLAHAGASAQGGPVNDNFANRISIIGANVTTTGTNTGATDEAGEPNHAGASNPIRSVWWSWTAPGPGNVDIRTFGSNFNTTLGVYTGAAVNALTLIANNDNALGGQQSQVVFRVVPGTEYQIAVAGNAGAMGNITLAVTLAAGPPPLNDDFADRIALAGGSLTTTGTNVNSGLELGEPNHAGASSPNRSVWWSWTPAVAGVATVNTFGSGFNTTLGVYTGGTVDALAALASNDNALGGTQSLVAFRAVPGTEYQIAVAGFQGFTGNITLNLTLAPPAANDNFADRITLTGASSSATAANGSSTGETGEPDHAAVSNPIRSVWWTWTASSPGVVTIDTFGSNFNTTLAVYTGPAVNALTAVAGNDDAPGSQQSQVSFAVVMGTTYQIAVAGFQGFAGNITLTVTLGPPPNDNFANRIVVAGTNLTLTWGNLTATGEPGEPDHGGGSAPMRSVWWSWTAPSSGLVIIHTFGSNFDTTLGAYTGTAVNALTLVAGNNDADGGLQSRVVFPAVAGTTYQVAVAGFQGDSGTLILTITLGPIEPPPNDDFAGRIALTGANAGATGWNVNATGETGEPNHAGASVPVGSAWWTWTAPFSGTVTIHTFGSNYDTTLGVYTGSAVGSLTFVAASDDAGGLHSRVSIPAVGATVYQIAVAGHAGAQGNIALTIALTFVPTPANDDFSGMIALSGASITTMGTNLGATRETGEPNHAGNPGGRSIWWTWTAPASGPAAIDTFGSNFDTLLAVYTGDFVSALTEVASNDDAPGLVQSRVAFNATAGTTYRIAVDGDNGGAGADSGVVTLRINPPSPPPSGGGGRGGGRSRCGFTGLEAVVLLGLLWFSARARRARNEGREA